MKKALIFDLDGTLLNTLADLTDAVNFALDAHGMPRRTLEEVRRFLGNGAAQLIQKCVPAGSDYAPVLATYQPYYNAHCREKTGPYAGIPQALARLQEKYAIAVVSNKPDQPAKELVALYFPGYYALGQREDIPRKPAPDMVAVAARELGVEQKNCIYIGDSEVDVLTAKNAGIPCVSVLWGFRDRQEIVDAGGKYFAETPEQMVEILNKMEEELLG